MTTRVWDVVGAGDDMPILKKWRWGVGPVAGNGSARDTLDSAPAPGGSIFKCQMLVLFLRCAAVIIPGTKYGTRNKASTHLYEYI